LFRPPFGDKDATTLRVVHDCGMKAAFFWKETVNNGAVQFQEGNSIKAGDIILMHFRPNFAGDFTAALQDIAAAGLVPARLTDYVVDDTPPPPVPTPVASHSGAPIPAA